MTTYVYIASREDHAKRFPSYALDRFDGGPGLYDKATGDYIGGNQSAEIRSPMVMRDIASFVARAHYDRPQRWRPKEITSRSHLRRYEIDHGLRQAGDFKKGEIIGDVVKKREREAAKAERLAADTGLRGPRKDFEWT